MGSDINLPSLARYTSGDTERHDNRFIPQRFISRRGKVRQLRSDQGSNFVGAKNELANAVKGIDRTPSENT